MEELSPRIKAAAERAWAQMNMPKDTTPEQLLHQTGLKTIWALPLGLGSEDELMTQTTQCKACELTHNEKQFIRGLWQEVEEITDRIYMANARAKRISKLHDWRLRKGDDEPTSTRWALSQVILEPPGLPTRRRTLPKTTRGQPLDEDPKREQEAAYDRAKQVTLAILDQIGHSGQRVQQLKEAGLTKREMDKLLDGLIRRKASVPETLQAHNRAIKKWIGWCAGKGYNPAKPTAIQLALFLQELSEGGPSVAKTLGASIIWCAEIGKMPSEALGPMKKKNWGGVQP